MIFMMFKNYSIYSRYESMITIYNYDFDMI